MIVTITYILCSSASIIFLLRYWPAQTPMEEIQRHVEDHEIGDYEVKVGTHLGKRVMVHTCVDENYNSSFMSSFGKNARSGKVQVRCAGQATFQYPDVEREYYYVRGAVDHNNQIRMSK